jgi:hypothetical protein
MDPDPIKSGPFCSCPVLSCMFTFSVYRYGNVPKVKCRFCAKSFLEEKSWYKLYKSQDSGRCEKSYPDPGKIYPDPQHCLQHITTVLIM